MVCVLLLREKRNQYDVEYFDYAYKTHMNETDKEEFEHLVNKYDLELETDFPNWLMCYYRETLLTIMRDLINNISAAYISLQIVLLLYFISNI